MICQNCQAEVDNDLIFCTTCGARLSETISQTPTALINGSIVTQTATAPVGKSPGSRLKWVAVIMALIALPLIGWAAYRLYSDSKQTQTAANQTKPSNQSTPSQNNQNTKSTTAGSTDEDWLNEKAPSGKRAEIWNERIEVAPGDHYSVSFSIDSDAHIIGEIEALRGTPIEGYVFLQSVYDEHSADPIYKVFSFDGEKTSKIEQTLTKENYVLVFVNNSNASIMIQGKIFTVKQ